MAGRPHRYEGGVRGAGHHRIDSRDGSASGELRRLQRFGVHRSVGVERGEPFLRRRFLERAQIAFRMNAPQLLAFDEGRDEPIEALEFFLRQRCLDNPHPIGLLRMTWPHVVFERGRMSDKQGAQYLTLAA
jgi:hypothetical protein